MLTGTPLRGSTVGYKGSDCTFLNEFLRPNEIYEVLQSHEDDEYFVVRDELGEPLAIYKDEGDYEHFYMVLSTMTVQNDEPDTVMKVTVKSSPAHVKEGQIRTNIERDTYWLIVIDTSNKFNAVTVQDDLVRNFQLDYPSGATAEEIAEAMPIVCNSSLEIW